MLVYRDRLFCSAPCRNTRCDRRLTPEIIADATAWTESFRPKGSGALIDQADLSEGCDAYVPNLEPADGA